MKPIYLLIYAALTWAAIMAVLAASQRSHAADLPLLLNDQDQQTLVQGLNALIKTQGLTSVTNGTAAAVQALYQKLQQAAQAAQTKDPTK